MAVYTYIPGTTEQRCIQHIIIYTYMLYVFIYSLEDGHNRSKAIGWFLYSFIFVAVFVIIDGGGA